MKLELHGHQEHYVIEQSLLTLFPEERPVYTPILPTDDTWAIITLEEEKKVDNNIDCKAVVTLSFHGKKSTVPCQAHLHGTEFEQEGQRRRLIGKCFFLAAREVTGITPPWGMLSGVRPDKLAVRLLHKGHTEEDTRNILQRDYFISSERAALAIETGKVALQTAENLAPQDIAVYISIPFCPTRCAYCSFVSQSVEKSFSQIPFYVDKLIDEIQRGGEAARRFGLRVRAVYMGGGTPTTLDASQLHRVLSAFENSFDLSTCEERTVEAGRPDTVTAEKLNILRQHGIDRISINPQSMENTVLRAIDRRHTAEDVEKAMDKVAEYHFPCVNMDLIAGLPRDTLEGFKNSLLRCLNFHTDNITVHTLSMKKGSRILTEQQAVPDADTVGQMLDFAAVTLRQAGYVPYYLYRQKYMSGRFENIGWCKVGKACLYNIYIMSELCTILSFGAGGSTKIIAPPHMKRLFHPKYAKEYIERPVKDLSATLSEFYSKTP